MTSPAGAGAPVSGLVVVDKPAGLTSHDVVARVRRLARTRKVGHAGTLDPMATGVLLVAVGRATRLLGHLSLTDKAYDATIRLGASTVTDDAEGEVVATAPVDGVSEQSVRDALAVMVGDIEQVPSAVSAVKVQGRRSYDRVRAGEQVDLPARLVTIHELTVTDVARTAATLDIGISVRCSSGTYVRAIARDVGAALGVGGHLTALRRTAVGPVGVDEATPLARLVDAGEVRPAPLADVVGRFFPTVTVDADAARDVGFGRPLGVELGDGGPVAVMDADGAFLALYRRGEDGSARPVSVFV